MSKNEYRGGINGYTCGRESGLEDDPDYKEQCNLPEHNPPMHIFIPRGKRYCHICPACGYETVIRSNAVDGKSWEKYPGME